MAMTEHEREEEKHRPRTSPTDSLAETMDSGYDLVDGAEKLLRELDLGFSTADRYEIGTALGEGGMALVHLATDRQLGRQVALKRLRPELAENPNARARFLD